MLDVLMFCLKVNKLDSQNLRTFVLYQCFFFNYLIIESFFHGKCPYCIHYIYICHYLVLYLFTVYCEQTSQLPLDICLDCQSSRECRTGLSVSCGTTVRTLDTYLYVTRATPALRLLESPVCEDCSLGNRVSSSLRKKISTVYNR